LVTQRITENLEERIEQWRSYKGNCKAELTTLDPPNVYYRKKISYARDLASALHYLHQHNLALLNLSPVTIGFLENGTIQISDLSCCREASSRKSLMEDGDCTESTNSKETVEEEDLSLKRQASSDSVGLTMTSLERQTSLGRQTSAETKLSKKKDETIHVSNFLVSAAADGGVPRYLAPELVVDGQVSLSADCYS
jgi:hypothetical protein